MGFNCFFLLNFCYWWFDVILVAL